MNINLTAPFCSTSYGMVALNILRELTNLGHKVSAFPIGGIETTDIPHQFRESLQKSIDNSRFFDTDAPSVRLYHQFDLAQHIGRGKRIGWPIFELDKFNDLEKHHLFAQDEIIVCSQWAKNVIHEQSNGMINKIHVVPLGVDPTIFSPALSKRSQTAPTTFIHIGKKETRKGHDFILECFEKAFKLDDNILLVMIWGNRILDHINPQESKAWTDMYRASPMHQNGKIQLIEWLATQQDVADFLQRADCGLFPSRAEGWNLDLLEAMACGTQVIATDYSAHTEYVNDDNAYLIKGGGVETAYDGIWFHGQGNWLNIDQASKDGIVAQMQWIHKLKQGGDELINRHGIETAKRFSWKNTAETLLKVI